MIQGTDTAAMLRDLASIHPSESGYTEKVVGIFVKHYRLVTAERDNSLAAARLLREDLADMVNQHGGAETCLSANETAVKTLATTAWLDEGEGQR